MTQYVINIIHPDGSEQTIGVEADSFDEALSVAKEKYPTYHIGRVRSCDDMSSYVNLVDKINKHGKNK